MSTLSKIIFTASLALILGACASSPADAPAVASQQPEKSEAPVKSYADDDFQGVISLDDLKQMDQDQANANTNGSAGQTPNSGGNGSTSNQGQGSQAAPTPASTDTPGSDSANSDAGNANAGNSDTNDSAATTPADPDAAATDPTTDDQTADDSDFDADVICYYDGDEPITLIQVMTACQTHFENDEEGYETCVEENCSGAD